MVPIITFFLITTLLSPFSKAHYYMSWPNPRQRIVNDAPRCENGNTDIPQSNNFEAGSWFVPRHGKTNHNGGFDLYSLVKLQSQPSVQDMIDEKNIFHMECQTLNCVTPDFNNGGTFVSDQDVYANSCWGSGFNWPNTPGEFTMFWYNWGSFGSEGIAYLQLPVYSNCANIRLTPSKTNSGNGTVPKCTFGGGDDTRLDWNGRRPTNQECAYKRFKNPPPSAQSTNDAIAKDKSGDKSQLTLSKGVDIGVPDMAVNGGNCKRIKNPLKITSGPWDGNDNKMPPPPPGGYTYNP